MNSTIKIPLTVICISVFLVLLLFSMIIFTKSENAAENSGYYMKSLNNTVVLYKDDTIIKVYDGIIVDTLPTSDRDLLNKGIYYENIADADIAAEDYDG